MILDSTLNELNKTMFLLCDHWKLRSVISQNPTNLYLYNTNLSFVEINKQLKLDKGETRFQILAIIYKTNLFESYVDDR